MGLFEFFKKQPKQPLQQQVQQGGNGPAYLRGRLTVPEADVAAKFKILYPGVQWAGQLCAATQNRWFSIKYYGQLMSNETIVATPEAVQKVVAVDVQTGEEILLFDKTLHGWDGFICDNYKDDKAITRNADKTYVTNTGSQVFKIVFSPFYNNTLENLSEAVNASGMIETATGMLVTADDAFGDAFDALVVYAIDEDGMRYELINEELA